MVSKARPNACLALAASRRMWALLGGLHVVAARTGMLLGARYVKVNRSM